jgi:hypothetical protein
MGYAANVIGVEENKDNLTWRSAYKHFLINEISEKILNHAGLYHITGQL